MTAFCHDKAYHCAHLPLQTVNWQRHVSRTWWKRNDVIKCSFFRMGKTTQLATEKSVHLFGRSFSHKNNCLSDHCELHSLVPKAFILNCVCVLIIERNIWFFPDSVHHSCQCYSSKKTTKPLWWCKLCYCCWTRTQTNCFHLSCFCCHCINIYERNKSCLVLSGIVMFWVNL